METLNFQNDFNPKDFLKHSLTDEEASSFFRSLTAVSVDELIGEWRGSEIQTGHPFNNLLADLGWYGKAFFSPENVHPLLFKDSDNTVYSFNSNLLPIKLVLRLKDAAKMQVSKKLFRFAGPSMKTRKSTARLRLLSHEGKESAAMIYDGLPIIDFFRKIEQETVMGKMDLKGLSRPFYFVLAKNHSPSDFFRELRS